MSGMRAHCEQVGHVVSPKVALIAHGGEDHGEGAPLDVGEAGSTTAATQQALIHAEMIHAAPGATPVEDGRRWPFHYSLRISPSSQCVLEPKWHDR